MPASVVVAGTLAGKPGNGGEAWVRLSYVLGLRRLGFGVRFVEQAVEPSAAAIDFFRRVTGRFGIEATLLDGGGRPLRGEAVEGGDLLVNVSGNLRSPRLLRRFRRTVYVDVDPAFTQFWHERGIERLPAHDLYFTVAQNIGRADCAIPTDGIRWQATRPPVVLDEWPVAGAGFDRFTTVSTWRSPFGRIDDYGLKHHEWRKVIRLPALAGVPFEAAVAFHPADGDDRRALEAEGWHLVDPAAVDEPDRFRAYVRGSGAEFSVAQGIYVETRSGWFSDRSARYLAAGRPVLVQDTGFTRDLPTGEGLLAFGTIEEAVSGSRAIVDEYARHARAARALAEQWFDSDRVLGAMLEDAL